MPPKVWKLTVTALLTAYRLPRPAHCATDDPSGQARDERPGCHRPQRTSGPGARSAGEVAQPGEYTDDYPADCTCPRCLGSPGQFLRSLGCPLGRSFCCRGLVQVLVTFGADSIPGRGQ